jgi:hypothetical protein
MFGIAIVSFAYHGSIGTHVDVFCWRDRRVIDRRTQESYTRVKRVIQLKNGRCWVCLVRGHCYIANIRTPNDDRAVVD